MRTTNDIEKSVNPLELCAHKVNKHFAVHAPSSRRYYALFRMLDVAKHFMLFHFKRDENEMINWNDLYKELLYRIKQRLENNKVSQQSTFYGNRNANTNVDPLHRHSNLNKFLGSAFEFVAFNPHYDVRLCCIVCTGIISFNWIAAHNLLHLSYECQKRSTNNYIDNMRKLCSKQYIHRHRHEQSTDFVIFSSSQNQIDFCCAKLSLVSTDFSATYNSTEKPLATQSI